MKPTDLDLIDETAARWTVRLDDGPLTPSDQHELDTWLAAAPAHREALASHRQSWQDAASGLRALAAYAPEATRVAPPPRARRRAPWFLAGAGLAAALACVVVLWVVPQMRYTQTVSTVALQRSTLTLRDGSRAELNARTQLATDFRGDRRQVRLARGEALFTVAKDPAHPFRVETPAGTIEVTGTTFNVRLTAAGATEVTLLEGSVAVETETRKPETGNLKPESGSAGAVNSGLRSQVSGFSAVALTPGQQFNTARATVRTLTPAEIENAIAWRDGRLMLNGMTLTEAAERLSAYHGLTITVAAAIADVKLGGSYPLDDLQGFFRVLAEEPVSLRALPRGDGSYAIVPK